MAALSLSAPDITAAPLASAAAISSIFISWLVYFSPLHTLAPGAAMRRDDTLRCHYYAIAADIFH